VTEHGDAEPGHVLQKGHHRRPGVATHFERHGCGHVAGDCMAGPGATGQPLPVIRRCPARVGLKTYARTWRSERKTGHVVGTGTIGEPLIDLLADNKEHFGIDEVTFHKRTPLVTEKAKVNDLVRRGAVLAVDENRKATFEELGHSPKYEAMEAIERADVVIDCTPVGNQNKEEMYEK